MKNSRIGNNNIIDANATVTSGISIKDNNLVSAGESLFDDLESKELFQSGIIQRI
jgi:tetrahydrodipicolinate N-succinyltransferase